MAIKIIDKSKLKEEYQKDHLHREARILAQLRHPNIIRLYETLRVSTILIAAIAQTNFVSTSNLDYVVSLSQFVYGFVCLFVYLFVCLFVTPPRNRGGVIFSLQFVCVCVCVCLSVCLSVCPIFL